MNAIFLMGPTAAGKTEFALELSAHLPIEIISVDSAMVYRGMDIGTGKPTHAEQQIVPHHLIDIRDPLDPYSAAEFAEDARKKMKEITDRGRLPLLVGGTLLYFRALQQGLSPLPPSNPEIRAKLLREVAVLGLSALYERLVQVDKASSERIHPNDPQRIQRALEVYEISGKPMSSFFQTVEQSSLPYQIHSFALAPHDRHVLHQRIEDRFHKMLKLGFIEEVEILFSREDLNKELPSLRSVGYRQIWSYLEGKDSYDQMVYKSIVATRQLAKRQLTWLRSLLNLKWLEKTHSDSVKSVIHCLS